MNHFNRHFRLLSHALGLLVLAGLSNAQTTSSRHLFTNIIVPPQTPVVMTFDIATPGLLSETTLWAFASNGWVDLRYVLTAPSGESIEQKAGAPWVDLSPLNGAEAQGTWTLTVTEHAAINATWTMWVHFRLVVQPNAGTSFCSGALGATLGCNDCPCNNEAPAFSDGGCLNSTGRSAELFAVGTPSISNDRLQLFATDVSPLSLGVLVTADNALPANPMNPCSSLMSGIRSVEFNGLRCIGGNARRLGSRQSDVYGEIGVTNVDNNGAAGTGTAGWGIPDGPIGGLAASGGFVAGQTAHFQVFYRDAPVASCTEDINTTNGVSVVFVP